MSALYIGLMSGTSLDGVDAALVDFAGDRPSVRGTRFLPYPDSIRAEALALNSPGDDEIHRSALLSRELSRLYAEAVELLLGECGVMPRAVAAIGCHGQTVRHRADLGYTVQLVDPALLVERTGIPVVANFRARDLAAEGQGAPLVPAFHAGAFRHADRDRVILNVGGIANITALPASGTIIGFDTGPGNVLLDMWCARQRGCAFDADGEWAASGRVVEALLDDMLADPYFALPPPKSTGRDLYNEAWLMRRDLARYAAEDVQATLLELTARSVADAIERYCPGADELYVCGGGASNRQLLRRLQALLGGVSVSTTADLGLHPDWVEAVAFAWLARRTLLQQPGNLPEVTGAQGPRVLGAVYPT
ncbi:MAG TPA: anhydro-N-acetylmuramic acid kinase [Burkholderiales bacterium]|nr:anhydro-N-acetylmuramic acid kinase [Burkholderiales bacterium]